MAGITGFGTTLSFASGFHAMIRAVNHTGVDRKSIDVSSSDSTSAKDFLPAGLYDGGEIDVEMLKISGQPPFNAPEAYTITYNDGTTDTGTGFLIGWESSSPYEGEVTVKTKIKCTGAVTIS